MLRFYFVIIAFLLLMPFQVFADVIINEVCWMGTESSYADEWLELYNSNNSAVNLEGWILKAVDGTPEINLSGSIPSFGFYLLERTDDDTVPGIRADQIYTGALSNKGEKLELYDDLENLIDSIDCSDSWLAGDNQTKQTMERTDSGDWQNSLNPGGTPKTKNTASEKISEPKPITEPEPEAQPEPEIISQKPTETKTYPSGIIINEILPSPEGPDNEEEWLELKNLNNQTVDISDWKIQDTVGSTKTHVFPEGTKIQANGYLVLPRPTTKITLNNSGDGLKLIQPNGNILDAVSYEKAPLGQSYNRTESGWILSAILTPGAENMFPKPIEPSPAPPSEGAKEKELAAIGEQMPKSPKSLYVFLIALLLAIFSGIIVLIVKKKLKNVGV